MKKVQVPILVGAVGLVAAAAFVIVPLADGNNSSAPGINVGEPTDASTGQPSRTAVGENEVFIQFDDGTVTPKSPDGVPSSRALLEEKRQPGPPSRGGAGGGGPNEVCEWDDGEWDCDDDWDDDWDDDDDDD